MISLQSMHIKIEEQLRSSILFQFLSDLDRNITIQENNSFQSMSANRFKAIRPKLQDPYRKDLTPKNTKPNKFSPAYSSFRGGATLKPESSGKIKILRPSTSKHSQTDNTSHSYFYSKQNRQDKKSAHNSTKKMEMKTSVPRKITEHQPRAKSKSPQKHNEQIIREEVFIHPKKFNISSRQIRIEGHTYPLLPKNLQPISNFQSAKHSTKANGYIKAYAASTNQGPVRDYNEDRVAIILNIAKPQHCNQWRKAAYFGVFDGHGGVDCADFLRDNLHVYITKEKSFPINMNEAIASGFGKCQATFLQKSKSNMKVDRSGSCANVAFLYGDKCYIANVGDSRAIMSSKQGGFITELSIDHKANDQYEQKRIIQSGGKIYQTKLQNANPNIKIFYEGQEHDFIMGPHRVMPGRLSVTRTFGDLQAKLPQFGGNPNAIISTPQIRSFTISPQHDFLLLASDGIFDKLSNAQIIQMVWETFSRDQGRYHNIHQFCGLAVQNIMKLAFHKKTLDNITVVMIALQGLQNYFAKLQIESINSNEIRPTFVTNGNNHTSSGPFDTRKNKLVTKIQSSFQRKYIGRSTSPSNYSSIRSRTFYRT